MGKTIGNMMMNHEIWGCLIFRQAEIDMNGKIFSPSEKGFFVAHQLTVPAFYKCGIWLPLLLRYSWGFNEDATI
jgi:hypothetical protein